MVESMTVLGTYSEKIASPVVQGFERVRRGHIVDENATVSTTVESHAQTLEPLLASRVPNLCTREMFTLTLTSEERTCIVTRRSSI